jgi:hypothetical protein
MSQQDLIEKATRALVALCLLAGCVLRLTALDVHSLWFDECGTLAVALADSPTQALLADRHPPLSFWAIRGVSGWLGESDSMLRLLPALLSCGALLLFALWSRSWPTQGARPFAIAMFALSPFQIWMGQEVRMYPFVEFGALLALVGADRAQKSAVSGAALVAFGTACAFGSHYLGACAALLACVRGTSLRSRGPAILAAGLGLAVWVPWLLFALASQLQSEWGDTLRVAPADFAELVPRLLSVEFDAVDPAWHGPVYALGALAWIAVARCALLARSERECRDALVLFALPVVVTLALALTVGGGFQPRYLLLATPGLSWAMALGLRTRRAWIGGALGAVLCMGLLLHTVLLRQRNLREDYSAACAEVENAWRPGDRVVSITGTSATFADAPLRHYLRARPDILASLTTWRRVTEELSAGSKMDFTLHVVCRDSHYARPELEAIAATMDRIAVGEARFRIQHSSWRSTR